VLNDVRYAWRQLRRTPSFTAVAVITLALGIGTNTTFFGLIDAAIWRPGRALDFSDQYNVYLQRPHKPRARQPFELNVRVPTNAQIDYLKSRPELGILAATEIFRHHVVAQTSSEAGRLTLDAVEGDYAGVTRMRPLHGQLAGLENNGAQAGRQVVISERLWRTWFRADVAAVGRDTIRINRQTFTIAGVASLAQSHEGVDLWMASQSWRIVEPHPKPSPFPMLGSVQLRFRPGSEPTRLRPMIDQALASGPTPPPEEFKAQLWELRPVQASAYLKLMTKIVIALSAVVLLAACANLANMLYARAAQRSGEIAVRVSLGAGSGRIFRLFLIESGLIAGLAALSGALVAWLALRYVVMVLPGATIDRYTRAPVDVSPDWRVFAYAVGAGALATLIVGGLTAWRGSRTPPLRMLGGSGIADSTRAGNRWLRTVLVDVQVSAALILLLGTGLYLIRGLDKTQLAMTFQTDQLATAQIEFDSDRFNPTDVSVLLQRILDSVERFEGIEAGAITDGMFGGLYARPRQLMNLVAENEFIPGTVSRSKMATGLQAAVSPRFLDVLGLKLLKGRNLQPTDVEGAPEVTLLSASAAQRLWPGEDPLGRRVKLAGDKRWFTVVGTFEDPQRSVTGDTFCAGCVALSSWSQTKGRQWLVVLRSKAPGTAIQQVRPAVDAINQDVPVLNATIADHSIFNITNAATAFSGLVGSLGFIALAIAALGVYGVISYSVSRRTREFGIRLALGATPKQILKAVLDDAVHLVLVGLLPGVLLASWATRTLESQIIMLMPNEISTWAAVPILILVIGVFAAWIPARRASRVNPIVALRHL
jgi:predicted permease